jgi:hypothetical protein
MPREGAQAAAGSGVGFFSLLGLLFIWLKLTKVIDWPWLWVTAPLWGQVLLGVAIVIVVLVVGLFVIVFSGRSQ